MSKRFEDLRIRLIQARNTPEMEHQEQECFLERCRIESTQLLPVNVIRDPIDEELLDGVDALMIGGAGEYSATQDYRWTGALHRLVQLVYERGFPTFGSCWGHQVLARALGGDVIYDVDRAELGCDYVELTEAGRQDPLFRSFPRRFRVNMGHHDRVTRLPPMAVELAVSDSQGNQAFRFGDKPIYSTQFHSELDAVRERERLYAYRDYYQDELGDEEDFNRILHNLAETTEVDHLLYDFLSKCVVDAVSFTDALPTSHESRS